MKKNFYGNLLSFLAILIASFAFLMGLAYWNGLKIAGENEAGETICITSSGEAC